MLSIKILNILSEKETKEHIEKTAFVIKHNGIIVLPTETVYGISALMKNQKAINKIYQLRKRPRNKALLILIGRKKDVKKYAQLTPRVQEIIKKFWPGPLTIILPKKRSVPDYITARQKTVAIRMPENKFLLALIKKIGQPIVAPSANLSGGKSPITAQETFKDFLHKVDLILDGGKTKYQRESTILDLTGKKPKIIREGAIKEKKLRSYL